ncbi:MAG: hypothetical protein PHX88_12670 [Methanoculleus horonobensis]|nr:hypothetical protein [Methanoculleus horonobensis]
MFEDPNLIMGVGGLVVGAVAVGAGYLDRKRQDDMKEAERIRKAEAEEAKREREDATRRMILMNDLTRDAIAGQETTDYGQDLVKAAASN